VLFPSDRQRGVVRGLALVRGGVCCVRRWDAAYWISETEIHRLDAALSGNHKPLPKPRGVIAPIQPVSLMQFVLSLARQGPVQS
jgi:hypothetical protein